jgi:copper chaperone
MTCGHCAGTVTRAVQQAAPAAQVTVDLKSGTVGLVGQHDAGRVVAAIEAAGYKAQQPIG